MSNILKKILVITNIVMISLVLIIDFLCCFVFEGMVTQYITAFMACGLSIFNFVFCMIYRKKEYIAFNILIFIGVIFCSFADFLLGLEFVAGALLFGVGHILYIIAMFLISKFKWIDLLFMCAIIGVSLVVVFVPSVDYEGFLPLIVGYAVILSIMCAKCLSNYFLNDKKNLLNIVIMIAGVLFYLSDLMLLLYFFKNASILAFKWCIMLYYPSIAIFAVALLLNAIIKDNEKNKKTVTINQIQNN